MYIHDPVYVYMDHYGSAAYGSTLPTPPGAPLVEYCQVCAQEKKNFQVLHMYCIFAYKFHKDTPFIEVDMNISSSSVRTILGKMPWGGPVTTGI